MDIGILAPRAQGILSRDSQERIPARMGDEMGISSQRGTHKRGEYNMMIRRLRIILVATIILTAFDTAYAGHG